MASLSLGSASQSSSPDVLEDVTAPDCNLAIWRRASIVGLPTLLVGSVSDLRFATKLSDLPRRLPSELDANHFPDGPVRDDLVADICQLGVRFCDVLALEALDVRLEVVTTDSCRKWHADYVKARLITTYIGTGTQWLEADDAERVKRNLEPVRIREMAPGDVGLFKGKLATETPVIHRSPPIAGSGETRLLLVLNPPEEH